MILDFLVVLEILYNNMSTITVVLTKYKRLHLFQEQLEAINSQSIAPTEILVCDNSVDNLGVWARFALALNAKSDFVCVIDDDTIPGNQWLENCMTQMEIQEGLYGTCGYIFLSKEYMNNKRIGWPNPNDKTIKVDYVVHNWFFKKDWLKYYWSEIPEPKYWLCGEDMHFSYQMQKIGIETFVPPHPQNDQSLWGSLKGNEYGRDSVSLWESNVHNFRNTMFDYFNELVTKKGWRLNYNS